MRSYFHIKTWMHASTTHYYFMKNIFLLIVVGLLVVQVRSDLGWDGNQCYYYYWWDCYYDGSSCYAPVVTTTATIVALQYSWGWDWGSDSSGRYPVYVRWCGWAKYSWHTVPRTVCQLFRWCTHAMF
jgi:hypothetical protein